MAKRRKQSITEPEVQAAPDTDGLVGSAMPPTQEAPVPAQRNPRRRPLVEIDEDDLPDDEFEEGEDDEFDEEDDEEDEDDDFDETPPLPIFPVTHTDPTLVTFLAAISTGDWAAAHALSDWLVDQSDPRAAHACELAEARCVIPEGTCDMLRASPMACGTWWCIVLRPGGVTASVYRETPLCTLLQTVRRDSDIVARVPRDRQTPERLGAAFERCRQGLLLGLFGTSVKHLQARQVILYEDKLERVDKILAKQQAVIPWLLELRQTNSARFEVVLARIWKSTDLHGLGYVLLDTVDPGWRQRLPAMMAGGASAGAGRSPQ